MIEHVNSDFLSFPPDYLPFMLKMIFIRMPLLALVATTCFVILTALLPANVSADAPAIISAPPYETAASDSSITFSWESESPANSVVRYGRTSEFEKGVLAFENQFSTHNVTLDGLSPAQIYRVKVGNASGSDTTWSDPVIVSTGSPSAATGDINTYFNGSVFTEAAWRSEAPADVDFGSHYASRIRNARHSVDITFYNISGDTGDAIESALIRAARFGARIRIIMHHNLNSPANNIRQNLLAAANRENLDLEIIQSEFGNNDGRDGLMHNKFAIIDYDSDDPADTWLITSSWNSTDPGSEEQYQNMIEFQDPALAGGYRAEFNQMWGSDGFEPDAGNARFSRNKEVVNPTRFWIDDIEIDIFFSPQANTQSEIISRLGSGEQGVALPKYLITQWPYRDVLQTLSNEGKIVRGSIGDVNIPNSASLQIFNSLSEFADVHDHGAASDILLHHKTAIIDPYEPGSGSGQVITGSMNWSRNGNENSDENTIIIRDDHIANLYYQEFAARYYEAGGTADLTITSATGDPEENAVPEVLTLSQNYPNPFNPTTRISFELPEAGRVTLQVYDVTGRLVSSILDGTDKSAGHHEVSFDAEGLSSGLYLYRISVDGYPAAAKTMMLVK